MALLTVKDLSFSYAESDKYAIEDLSFDIKEGEFVVVCGESGCGKSTLLKLIKSELAPNGVIKGQIKYDENALDSLSTRILAKDIGMVLQNPDNQIICDKVWHELAFGLENIGMQKEQINRKIAEISNFFGINTWFHNDTDKLSGGQKQLLNLASVMAMQPRLLLLDEPTSQLDPIASTEFIETLQKINKDLGLTILIVEHRLEELLPICDKVLVLESGKNIAFDEPKNISNLLKNRDSNHKMLEAMPTSVRIFNKLPIDDICPLTVREGRLFLDKHFSTCKSNPVSKTTPKKLWEVIISCKNLYFKYQKNSSDILNNVNFEVNKGEIINIVGGNGSGKSTFLLALAGILRPYSGKIKIAGKNIKDYKGNELYKENICLLQQNPQISFIRNTVKEELEEVKIVKKVEANDLEKIIELFQLEKLLKMHPYDLSGGESQKLALAKVLLLNPSIMLLDEPTKGLDAFAKKAIVKILKSLQQAGKTIIIVTHDIEFSASVADRCAMFFDGQIFALEPTRDFFTGNNYYTTSANRISRHLFGDCITDNEVVAKCLSSARKS